MFHLIASHRAATAALAISTLFLVGCADKNVPPASGTKMERSGSAGDLVTDTVTRISSPTPSGGPASVPSAQSTAGQGGDASLPASEVPKRSRRDSVALASMTKADSVLDKKWPVPMPAPLPGAVFPAKRVVAFYGNPLVKKMGVLGEYPKDEMLAKLDKEVARWAKADPSHPVVPALHLIVTVASATPGKNGLYRTQMFDTLTNMVYTWAKARHALLFVDVQIGKSSVMAELP